MFFFKKKIASLLLIILIIILNFFYLFLTKKEQNYFVNEGQGISYIATDLKNKNIINSAFLFKVYSKLRSSLYEDCKIVHIGEYHIEPRESYESLLDKFCNGKTILKTITIPEGLETREIIEILNKNKDLTGDMIVSYNEGIVLPETYSFKSGIKRKTLFDKMQQDLIDFVTYEWEKHDKNNIIKTPKDAIILASIVEKEAKTDEERPIIASVYINRLKLNMKLEACPTAIYEITKGMYKLPRKLTTKDTKIIGNYNTYRKKGLPIKPICNPGKKSILSVLYPEKTNYLYFVANADLSGNIFAENYKDHLKNIKQVRSKK